MPTATINPDETSTKACTRRARVRVVRAPLANRLMAAACGAGLTSLVATQSASAFTINLTYDANTTASPYFSQIQAATQSVANEYAADFSANTTVSILCYQSSSVSLGESFTSGNYYTYAQVRTAMQNHINSPDEALAFSSLPTTDPTNGGSFYVPTAQAQVLGLSNTAGDGHFAFNFTYPLNYNYNNRAVAGEYDFAGIAEHEFSEIMGRISQLNYPAGQYSIMDLFRYSGSGVRALSGNVGNAYFSMDGGNTPINTYNNAAVNGGDYGDWSGATNDSYNAFSNAGVANPVSAGDVAVMDVLGYNQPLDSTNVYWKLNQNGAITTASNWVGGKAPSTSQTAQFNLVGNGYTVSTGSNVNIGGLYVHNNSVTLNLSASTLTVQQTSTSADALIVGQTASENGTLALTNGTLTVNEKSGFASSIAQQANSTGYLFVNSGATFNDNGTLYIGEYGSGEIQCLGGTTNVTGTFSMAQNAGSYGRAALDSGAVLNTTFVNIGNNGPANFYQNGGTFNIANNLGVSNFGNSTGYFGMYGGNLNVSGYAFINYDSSGTATFNQTGGATWVGVGLVVGTFGGPGIYYLQQSAAQPPTLAVTGAETIGASAAIGGVPNGTFTQYGDSTNYVGYNANLSAASPTELYVGNGGYGVFNIYGGGTEVNGAALIASGSGSSVGVVNIINQDDDDPAELYVLGNEIIGDAGNGTMLVNNGTNLVVGSVTVGNNGTGSLTINNDGSVSAGTSLTIANNAGSIGNVNISSGLLSAKGLMTVGNSGSGTLTQTGGSVTSGNGGNNPELIIGNAANSVGTYVINGGGTLAVNGAVWLGVNGQGTINQNAGIVTVGSGIPNTLYVGHDSGSGVYLLSGSGSLVDNGDEIVGWFGTGTFNQTGGTNAVGSSSSPWHLYLGFQSGSTGTYLLSGNGGLTVNNVEQVGVSGSGIFNQSGGTQQVNGTLTLGVGASSQGLFLLSDPAAVGTSLAVSGNEVIGSYATGSGSTPGALFQQSGGTHTVGSSNSAATLTIAQFSGSSAIYQLSGGTLNVNGSGITGLMVGGIGTGVLNQSGGTLNTNYEAVGNNSSGTVFQSNGLVGGTHAVFDIQLGVAAGSSGMYLLSGGTLNASEEEIGVSGTGTFNQSGGSNLTNYLYVADSNGKGTYLLSSGTLQYTAETIGSNAGSTFQQSGGSNSALPGSISIVVGGYGETGFYNQSGGSVTAAAESIGSAGSSGTGTINMTGGVAQVGTVTIGLAPKGYVNLSGSAIFNISGPATNSAVQPLTVNPNGSLSITGNAKLNLLPHTTTTFTAAVIGSMSITGSGTLDVSNNALDLTTTSLSTATTLVANGFAHGAWTGAGLSSSSAASDTKHLTALGVIQNNQSGTALYTSSHQFEAVTPGAADVLVKYTYFGDSNLDGKVDGTDYTRVDNGYLTHLTGWFNGDFNYDNVINGSDYTLIDNAFNRQGAQLTAELASPTAQAAAAVPEPGAAGLIAVNAVALLRGRKRRES